MNQSVLFPDDQQWDVCQQCIVFPAQCGGALIECVISLSSLSAITAQEIQDEHHGLAVFSEYRFDIEEIAESYIDTENYNDKGRIELRIS